MKNTCKSRISRLAIFCMVIFIFSSCKARIGIGSDNIMYTSVDANSITHYYCFIDVVNGWTSPCQISLDGTLQHLTLLHPLPAIDPGQRVRIMFEVTNWNPAAPCQAPCEIDQVNFKAFNWLQVSPGYFFEASTPVIWTQPTKTLVNCYIPDNPPGSNGNYFLDPAFCTYLRPDINNPGGPLPYDWSQIGDVYNPNSFPVSLQTNNTAATGPCFFALSSTNGGIYVNIPPYTSYSYGNQISTTFGGVGTCLKDNPPFISLQSSQSIPSTTGTAWFVPLVVTNK